MEFNEGLNDDYKQLYTLKFSNENHITFPIKHRANHTYSHNESSYTKFHNDVINKALWDCFEAWCFFLEDILQYWYYVMQADKHPKNICI